MYDSSKYRINIPVIYKLMKDKSDSEKVEHLGRIAIATSVPLVVLCEYVRELFGDIPGIVDKHTKLIEFYTSKG